MTQTFQKETTMTMLRYHIQTGTNGSVLIPATPFAVGEEIEVVLVEKHRESPSTEERRQRKAAEQARVMDCTPEERKAAVEKFMKAWKGCLKGVPPMTAKEIRAERLEKKYGSEK